MVGHRAGIVCRRALRTTTRHPPRFEARCLDSLVGIVSNEKGNVLVNSIQEEVKMMGAGIRGQVGNA